jgi:hypothetical protein
MAEASLAATEQADAHFERRMNAARRLVDRSAALVDEAGERAAVRLESGAASAREALAGVQEALDAVGERLERVPVEARGAAATITQDLEQLLAAARHAGEETRAIDAAFQDRIRRNYEMLSQAVRLMGEVTAAAPPPSPESAEPAAEVEAVLTPTARPEPPPSTPHPVGLAEPSVTDRAPEPAKTDPVPAASVQAAASEAPPRRRTRLRLTPTVDSQPAAEPAPDLDPASDEEFQALFVRAGGPASLQAEAVVELNTEDGWTWKGLLGALDTPEGTRAGKSNGA